MSEQGPTGSHSPWAPGSRELPQEINDSLDLIRQQAVGSHKMNVTASKRQRELLAGTLERCKELKKRVKALLSNNRHLLQSSSRVRDGLQAQIEQLEAEVLRLDRLAASRESENIDLTDESLRLQNIINQGQACRLSLQEALGRREETIAALETNLSGLQARCQQLEDDHRARLADLEARNRTLQRQLDVRRNVPMTSSQPPARPGDAVPPPRWKGPVSWLVFIVLTLFAAFALDAWTSSVLWVILEIIVALGAWIIWSGVLNKLSAFESTSDLARYERVLEEAESLADEARLDRLSHHDQYQAATQDLAQKRQALTEAERAVHAAINAQPQVPAEVTRLQGIRDAACHELLTATASHEPTLERQRQFHKRSVEADKTMEECRKTRQRKAWLALLVRPISLAIPLLLTVPLLWDGIDGNQLVRDGLAPRGYYLGWLSSKGQPAHRLSTGPDLRVRTSPNGVLVDARMVPRANGGNVIIVDGYRTDGQPLETELEMRSNDLLSKRR